MPISCLPAMVASVVTIALVSGAAGAQPAETPPELITVFEQGGDANCHIPNMKTPCQE
ncbi:MAG: hypothetical protein ACYC6Y_14880 [Thermoguttaceae bacterium]